MVGGQGQLCWWAGAVGGRMGLWCGLAGAAVLRNNLISRFCLIPSFAFQATFLPTYTASYRVAKPAAKDYLKSGHISLSRPGYWLGKPNMHLFSKHTTGLIVLEKNTLLSNSSFLQTWFLRMKNTFFWPYKVILAWYLDCSIQRYNHREKI